MERKTMADFKVKDTTVDDKPKTPYWDTYKAARKHVSPYKPMSVAYRSSRQIFSRSSFKLR